MSRPGLVVAHRRERRQEDDVEQRAPPSAASALLQRGLHRRGPWRCERSPAASRGAGNRRRGHRDTVSKPRPVRVREHLVGLIAAGHRPTSPCSGLRNTCRVPGYPTSRHQRATSAPPCPRRRARHRRKRDPASMTRGWRESRAELAILRAHRDARQLRTLTAGRLRKGARCQRGLARAAAVGKEAYAPGAGLRETPDFKLAAHPTCTRSTPEATDGAVDDPVRSRHPRKQHRHRP